MYTHGKLAKPHSCPHCPYTSTTKANIRKHVIGRHEDPERRDFPCNKVGEFLTNLTNFSLQCPKKFKTSSNLVEHMKVHEPGYRYTCQVGHIKIFTELIFHKSKHRFAANNSALMWDSNSISEHTLEICSHAKSVVKSSSRSTAHCVTRKICTGCSGRRRTTRRRFGGVEWQPVVQSSTGRKNRGCTRGQLTRVEAAFSFAKCAGRFAQIERLYEVICRSNIQVETKSHCLY